jgi:hypothetical protein
MTLNIEYDPQRDFTPEGRKRIYSELNELLKETEEDNNLLEDEKQLSKREIYREMQNYEYKYETYEANIERVKKLFLGNNLNSSSLN